VGISPLGGRRTMKLRTMPISGQRSVMIASDQGADFDLTINVAVELCHYRLSGWIKNENVPGGGPGSLILVPDLDAAIPTA